MSDRTLNTVLEMQLTHAHHPNHVVELIYAWASSVVTLQ